MEKVARIECLKIGIGRLLFCFALLRNKLLTYLFGVFSECEDVRCFHFIQMPRQWVEFVVNECSSGWNLLYTIVFLYKKINQLMHTQMVSGTHHPLVCYFYLVAIL